MSEVKKRSEMDPAYMWAMTDLYPDDEAWEKELGVLEGRIPEYRDYEGRLGESAEKLGSFFKFSDEIGKMSARVYVYETRCFIRIWRRQNIRIMRRKPRAYALRYRQPRHFLCRSC